MFAGDHKGWNLKRQAKDRSRVNKGVWKVSSFTLNVTLHHIASGCIIYNHIVLWMHFKTLDFWLLNWQNYKNHDLVRRSYPIQQLGLNWVNFACTKFNQKRLSLVYTDSFDSSSLTLCSTSWYPALCVPWPTNTSFLCACFLCKYPVIVLILPWPASFVQEIVTIAAGGHFFSLLELWGCFGSLKTVNSYYYMFYNLQVMHQMRSSCFWMCPLTVMTLISCPLMCMDVHQLFEIVYFREGGSQ